MPDAQSVSKRPPIEDGWSMADKVEADHEPRKPEFPPEDPTFDFAEVKREARAERKLARMPNRAHRACFWTWPWGHVWKRDRSFEPAGVLLRWKCSVCGKVKYAP